MRQTTIALAIVLFAVSLGPRVAHAQETPASGTAILTTAPGVLPAWTSAGITVAGINPGSVTTSRFSTSATINLPVVARASTANATAGGFRITNTSTGKSFRCLVPTIDTRARVLDCLTDMGYNTALFSIDSIGNRERLDSESTSTTVFQDLDLRLTANAANLLNAQLSTTVFTTSVRTATGELLVIRDRDGS